MAAQPMLAGQVFSSTAEQTGVIELYTSEGCSSCPPADRWLNTFKDNPGTWRSIIPLAFHVDYWDYIGWKDRFAMPEYTQRQRRYARQQSLRTIYTPGFIYNGREWRNWFVKRFVDFPEGGAPGVLEVTVEQGEAGIRFTPTRPPGTAMRFKLALLGFGLSSRVEAGENTGRTLSHDFVVLDVVEGHLQPRGDAWQASSRLPRSEVLAKRYALAAWVQRGEDISPIQATGGYLDAPPR